MFLAPWKLKQPKSPKVPTFFPFMEAPGACAQSSTTRSLCFSAIFITAAMSTGMPRRCTTRRTLVRGVIFRSMSFGSITQVCGSMSAQTSFAPVVPKGMPDAQNV